MNELTVSTWVKADTLQAESMNWILAKGSLYYTPMSGYSLRCWHKQLAFFIVGPSNATTVVYGPTLQENVWYHIAGVYKGGEYLT